jgi:hypothetical protein
MIIMLIVESALVLSGLLMKRDVWGIIVCYWAILLVKNISDYIDEKRKEDDGG